MDYETPSLSIRQKDDITVLRLRNSTLEGSHEIDHIVGEVDNLLAAGARKMVVDLKHVRFVGSAALGMLINVQKRIKVAGGRMVLSHPEHIAELLRVSRTAQLFRLATDLREAQTLF